MPAPTVTVCLNFENMCVCFSDANVVIGHEYSLVFFGFQVVCGRTPCPAALSTLANAAGLLGLTANAKTSIVLPSGVAAPNNATVAGNNDGGSRLRRLSTQTAVINWGIDRVDQSYHPLDAKYNYIHDGNNVRVYVLDSGILFTHTEFASGRAVKGYDFVTSYGTAGACPVGLGDPSSAGHGTAVSGSVVFSAATVVYQMFCMFC